MDMDLPGRVGVEWVSKFCPVKGSTGVSGRRAKEMPVVSCSFTRSYF